MTRYARLVFALLVLTMMVITGALEAFADHGGGHNGTAISGHVDPAECRFVRWDGRVGYIRKEVAKTIRCAVRRWPVAGGADKAIDVAACESGLNPAAYNPGGYAGVYQQAVDYWPSRFRTFDVERFELRSRVLNGRANVTVSIRQVHRIGWGPWEMGSCA